MVSCREHSINIGVEHRRGYFFLQFQCKRFEYQMAVSVVGVVPAYRAGYNPGAGMVFA